MVSKYWRPGQYRVICDRCGFKKWNTECRHEWNGLFVCRDTCWEPRHPQEFVRGVPDDQTVPVPRPEPSDTFLELGEITPDDL